MKYTKIALLLFVVSSIIFASDGLTVNSMSYNNHGEIVPFAAMEENEFLVTLECREDTGAVDIVFAIDTSGRDDLEMDDVIERVEAVVNLLDTLGYDYRLGLFTFANRPVMIRDFDSDIPGYQMTALKTEYFTELVTIDYDDSGDLTSNSTDAIAHAITDYDWRTDAMHVVISFTDSPYYERGDGSGYSDYLDTEVYDLVLSTGTVVYFASCSHDPESDVFYEMISYDSGGRAWLDRLFEPSELAHDIMELLTTWEAIIVHISNDSDDTCDVNCILIPDDPACVEVLSSNPQTAYSVLPGDTTVFNFRAETDSSCMGPERAFTVEITGCGDTTIFRGTTTRHSCLCSPPEVTLLSPEMETGVDYVFSSCPTQDIKFLVFDEELWYVDLSTVHFVVDSVDYEFDSSDHLSLEYFTEGDIIVWSPSSEWTHGDTVEFMLDEFELSDGCPSEDIYEYSFIVDLMPPEILSVTPPDGSSFDSTFTLDILAQDNLSGIDLENIVLHIDGEEYGAEAPLLTYTETDSGTIFHITGSPYVYGDLADSSISVYLTLFDNSQLPSCDTNVVGSYVTYTINHVPNRICNLRRGWNLVSNPCVSPFYYRDYFDSTFVELFTYNCEGDYENPDSLDITVGAWLLSPENLETHYFCEGADTLIYNLCPGWSLIGVSDFPVSWTEFTDSEVEIFGPYSYNSSGLYDRVLTLFPNIGYWILCSDSTEIIITR